MTWPLKEWLEEKIWPGWKKFLTETILLGDVAGYCEMLKGGTTTLPICHCSLLDRLAEGGGRMVKIRAVLSRGLGRLGTAGGGAAGGGLLSRKNAARAAADGRISVTYRPHALYLPAD